MLTPTSVNDALHSAGPIETVLVQGWVRTRRDSKDFSFLELNDGSCLRNLQIIAKNTLSNYAAVQHLITGASIVVRGALVASQGKGQSWEVVADSIEIVGASDDSYPLQKKGHTPEFLRELARRGLRGVKLVISDAHEGLKAAVAKVLHAPPGSAAAFIRCATCWLTPGVGAAV